MQEKVPTSMHSARLERTKFILTGTHADHLPSHRGRCVLGKYRTHYLKLDGLAVKLDGADFLRFVRENWSGSGRAGTEQKHNM